MIPGLFLLATYSMTLKMEALCCFETSVAFHTGVLLGYFFNPEQGGDIFLRNIDSVYTHYKALYSGR
jgi:hypothetical protein